MDALILAGGKGSRLSPWPAPKTLLPIAGVPMIERILRHLEDGGISRAIICTGYRAGDVEAAVNRRTGKIAVLPSNAGEDAPMGARLLRAREEHGIKGRVLVLYGDELSDMSIHTLVWFHEASLARMTFVGHRYRLPFGVVERTRIRDDEEVTVNIGLALAEPDCWAELRTEDGLSDWINRIGAREGAVACWRHNGKRATVNSLADLAYAEEVWR
ncbi:MAG: NTP transferase domain-containing protein [Dehalococcoidia bacterium]|nr:NTP transferase domain-containing protein [Dehalococcoidia bacterium]